MVAPGRVSPTTESRLAVSGFRKLRWVEESESEDEAEEPEAPSAKASVEAASPSVAPVSGGWASEGGGGRWDLDESSSEDGAGGLTQDGTLSAAAARAAAARFSGVQGGLAEDAAAYHGVRSAAVRRDASATALTAALCGAAEAADLTVEARRAGYVVASGALKGAHVRAELQLCVMLRHRRRCPKRRVVVGVCFLDEARDGRVGELVVAQSQNARRCGRVIGMRPLECVVQRRRLRVSPAAITT